MDKHNAADPHNPPIKGNEILTLTDLENVTLSEKKLVTKGHVYSTIPFTGDAQKRYIYAHSK